MMKTECAVVAEEEGLRYQSIHAIFSCIFNDQYLF